MRRWRWWTGERDIHGMRGRIRASDQSATLRVFGTIISMCGFSVRCVKSIYTVSIIVLP